MVYYCNARGDSPVEEFLDTLDRKAFIKVAAFIQYLAEQGPNLHRPYSDHVRGFLRELRIGSGGNSVRVLYCFMTGSKIVLLHGFLKKDQALRASDIELAENRMRDWKSRIGVESK
ncbi:MAG: hypothetical protein A2902_04620 [Elusimicrobia bacterium RIFCSPLOWO2_01_FULL_64_13]|nr:MAG: hypothetical protein A2636_03310 [Elusimicrobia bacterium RIFCSPHIGHO2_01_FULL_64_10]OGR97830.1 MAG: hypothetical protein A2902_04620 [Elusimicrobia bacterium RIFCSPLOWO2_01_FULL_64_13]